MVLLVLAGLFTRSLSNISREDLGIDVDSIVTFGITAQLSSYDQAELLVLYDRIEETLAAQPGVTGVGTTAIPLFYDFSLGGNVPIEGIEPAPGADTYAAATAVGSGYFDALDVALLSGRVFTDQRHGRAAARRDREPGLRAQVQHRRQRGRQAASATRPERRSRSSAWSRTRSTPRSRATFRRSMYYPRRQMAGWFQSMWVYVRGSVDADTLKAMIPRVMAEIAPDVPLVIVQTMRERLNDNVYIDRLLTTLSTGFAALATLLAGIGLYGVLAYNVQQRTRELGLRQALGAEPKQLRALVLKQVGVMALIGLGLGLAAALALGSGRRGRPVRVVGARPGRDRRRGRRARGRDSGGELAAGVARVADRADRGVAVRVACSLRRAGVSRDSTRRHAARARL